LFVVHLTEEVTIRIERVIPAAAAGALVMPATLSS
jgi:hypothetical protein